MRFGLGGWALAQQHLPALDAELARAASASRQVAHLQPEGLASATFSPDGPLVLMVSDDVAADGWAAHVFDVSSGRRLARLPHAQAVVGAAFAPDGAHVLTGCDDDVVRLWDIVGGGPLIELKVDRDARSPVAFSPDG